MDAHQKLGAARPCMPPSANPRGTDLAAKLISPVTLMFSRTEAPNCAFTVSATVTSSGTASTAATAAAMSAPDLKVVDNGSNESARLTGASRVELDDAIRASRPAPPNGSVGAHRSGRELVRPAQANAYELDVPAAAAAALGVSDAGAAASAVVCAVQGRAGGRDRAGSGLGLGWVWGGGNRAGQGRRAGPDGRVGLGVGEKGGLSAPPGSIGRPRNGLFLHAS